MPVVRGKSETRCGLDIPVGVPDLLLRIFGVEGEGFLEDAEVAEGVDSGLGDFFDLEVLEPAGLEGDAEAAMVVDIGITIDWSAILRIESSPGDNSVDAGFWDERGVRVIKIGCDNERIRRFDSGVEVEEDVGLLKDGL